MVVGRGTSADEDQRRMATLQQQVTALRQQVLALASITGVLTAALRRSGLMTDDLEALLSSGLVDAAAAQSEPVRTEWERVAIAVQKVATAVSAADRG